MLVKQRRSLARCACAHPLPYPPDSNSKLFPSPFDPFEKFRHIWLVHSQGEAIAYNLREMFGLRVPILSLVIGEGGSGGALAIGCANRNLILENSVYYVASPEACAAILWKNRGAAGQVGFTQGVV